MAGIPWESRAKKDKISSLTFSESNVRKPLFKLSLQQQRSRLSSIFIQLREVATLEDSTPTAIAALVLQLLANEEDSKVAKEIVSSRDSVTLTITLFLLIRPCFCLIYLKWVGEITPSFDKLYCLIILSSHQMQK